MRLVGLFVVLLLLLLLLLPGRASTWAAECSSSLALAAATKQQQDKPRSSFLKKTLVWGFRVGLAVSAVAIPIGHQYAESKNLYQRAWNRFDQKYLSAEYLKNQRDRDQKTLIRWSKAEKAELLEDLQNLGTRDAILNGIVEQLANSKTTPGVLKISGELNSVDAEFYSFQASPILPGSDGDQVITIDYKIPSWGRSDMRWLSVSETKSPDGQVRISKIEFRLLRFFDTKELDLSKAMLLSSPPRAELDYYGKELGRLTAFVGTFHEGSVIPNLHIRAPKEGGYLSRYFDRQKNGSFFLNDFPASPTTKPFSQ